MSLGKNLKYLREKNGLSQIRLAVKASISQSIISDTENGVRNPRIDTLVKLANALGVSISELLDENKEAI